MLYEKTSTNGWRKGEETCALGTVAGAAAGLPNQRVLRRRCDEIRVATASMAMADAPAPVSISGTQTQAADADVVVTAKARIEDITRSTRSIVNTPTNTTNRIIPHIRDGEEVRQIKMLMILTNFQYY